MPPSPVDWTLFRAQMPISAEWSYLDNAAVAPLSGPARAAIRRWSDEAAEQGDTVWPQWAKQVEGTRSLAAAMIAADPDEIALVANTTTGISLVAEGFPWRRGDNVVIPDNEFPTNAYPWLNLADRGVEVRRVAVPDGRLTVDILLEACDSHTRLIALSWVGFVSGWRVDIAAVVEAAHARGILVLLDAIQGLGVFPLNVRRVPVDFLAADGHKWMLGPEGAGLLYIRGEHLERLHPIGVGWNSVVHSHNYSQIALQLRPAAARYEGGSANMPGMLAFGASLALLTEAGLGPDESQVAHRVLEITDLASDHLQRHGCRLVSVREGDHRSGILSFDVPASDAAQLRKRCLDAGVVLSCRGSHLRISPHAYATAEDIDRLIDALGS